MANLLKLDYPWLPLYPFAFLDSRTNDLSRTQRREFSDDILLVLRDVARQRGVSRQDDLQNRETSLKRLGYTTYRDYVTSPLWEAVYNQYTNSKLLHNCMVCGVSDYRLHHLDYRQMWFQDIRSFFPLCCRHQSDVRQVLAEYDLPCRFSLGVLWALSPWDSWRFNRTLLPYYRQLLWEQFDRLGWKVGLVGKPDKSTGSKRIRVYDPCGVRHYVFDTSRGMVDGKPVLDFVVGLDKHLSKGSCRGISA